MNRLLLSLTLVFLMLASSCSLTRRAQWDDDDPTTVILVRHAEKGGGNDPDLSVEGRARAQRLAVMLQRIDLDAIYATDTRRAKQTAQAVADAKSQRVQEYRADNLDDLIREIQRRNRGNTVLVVGHSNTTPELAGKLDPGSSYPQIPEEVYDELYIVNDAGTREAEVLIIKY